MLFPLMTTETPVMKDLSKLDVTLSLPAMKLQLFPAVAAAAALRFRCSSD